MSSARLPRQAVLCAAAECRAGAAKMVAELEEGQEAEAAPGQSSEERRGRYSLDLRPWGCFRSHSGLISIVY